MAIPFAADLADILVTAEFASDVTYDGGTIKGVFDNETVPVDTGGYVAVHEEQPRLTCRTADVSSISYNQTMVINAVTYYVRAWIHDGTGVTVVQLEKS
tara:strand:- start:672 stop:968 length:297 start_codon:yes stop_codon:yes gene_type:complete